MLDEGLAGRLGSCEIQTGWVEQYGCRVKWDEGRRRPADGRPMSGPGAAIAPLCAAMSQVEEGSGGLYVTDSQQHAGGCSVDVGDPQPKHRQAAGVENGYL